MQELNNMEMQDINGGEFFKWLGKKVGEAAHSVVEGIREVNKYDPDYFGRQATGRQW